MGLRSHARTQAHARTRASSSTSCLHLIKPPIFICVISQFQSNNQSDPGAAALAGLGGGGRRERDEGEAGREECPSPGLFEMAAAPRKKPR